MIEDIINSLEQLSRNDLRRISRANFAISHILTMETSQLLEFCNKNYENYFRLSIQLSKIYMFDVILRDFGEALSIHNNLLQLIEFDSNYMKFQFDILYLKTLVYHFALNEEKAFALAEKIYNLYYFESDEKRRVLIDKLLGLTTPEIKDAIKYSERALQSLETTNDSLTEKGWIYKNLAFYYLKTDKFPQSLSNLKKLMKISPFMDEPQSFTLLVLTRYIEILNEIVIEGISDRYMNEFNIVKNEIDNLLTDFETMQRNVNKLISKISTIFNTSTSVE